MGELGLPGPNDTAEFTTGLDTTADLDPVVIAATRYPVGAGPYSRSVGYVVASFNKEVQNVTAATFSIAPAAASGVPYFSPDQKTWYLPLNTLTYAQIYTVDLDDTVGTGIEDLAGNDLLISANNNWTFTVEADPNPGGPITIDSVWLTNVTENSVRINWTTTRPATGFTVRYGLTTAYGSNEVGGGDPDGALRGYYGLNDGNQVLLHHRSRDDSDADRQFHDGQTIPIPPLMTNVSMPS
ncbi:MAG: Ig-like domain-containing protein, partial [Spirochaetota bacterium]